MRAAAYRAAAQRAAHGEQTQRKAWQQRGGSSSLISVGKTTTWQRVA